MNDKIKELSKKIASAKKIAKEAPSNIEAGSNSETQKELAFGSRLAIELIAGLLTGGCIGYFFDYIFNTNPLFIIIFLILGAASGFWIVYKLAITKTSDK